MSRSQRAANQADFAGPDADREAIERLARSARLANEQQQGGGRVADEVLQRNTLLIEAAQAELDELMGEVAKLRGVLGNRKKVAKNDGCDVEAIVQALRLKKQAGAGGSEPIVTRHRMVGRILGLLGHPLGTQFKLFGNDEAEAEAEGVPALMSRLLALDLGTRTGWALLQRGTPPRFGTLDLPQANEGEHQVRFALLHAWLVKRRCEPGFEALAFEQPILPRRAGELATTLHTLTLLWGLAAVAQLFAGQQGLPCEAVAVRDAKKALTDKALATKDEMVVAALQVMNWKVANDHEADAGAVGLVAYERIWPRIGPRSPQQ